ncbi:GerMN domain-containing protein [Kineococcus sp. SYSU DK003]|uniref:GerMN domain-containing protein n=1 Tax=Kineococcus sp. SYSU DK003 TaxID=3383124 RepID=UPI003D7EC141
MLQRLRPLVAAVLTLVGTTLGAVPASAATAPPTPTLVGIRAAHHTGYDRLVFDFHGGLPSRITTGYVGELLGDGSGLPVPLPGQAKLQIRFEGTDAHDEAGAPTAPGALALPLPNAMSLVRAGDYEAVTTYGVGLALRQPYRVFTLRSPDRVVLDVDAAFRTVNRQVWFFDEGRFVRNTPPFVVPVLRPVLPGTPATGVSDRLFAGPTAAEAARGLRFLPSGATGYRGLSITGGTARIQLTGGCSSGGSTVSIAGQLLPTLRQFPTVQAVKIFDPAGSTQNPTGPHDSIPDCLEP